MNTALPTSDAVRVDNNSSEPCFRRVLPPARLGTSHASLDAYRDAVGPFQPSKSKHYTLIVVTEPSRQRILLGLKMRGFGTGMYNSFGGKVEEGEDLDECASRELHEETGIQVSREHMTNCHVGLLHFTFDDSDTEMVVHLFRVNVCTVTDSEDDSVHSSLRIDPSVIRPCDEIIPKWFDSWLGIPLDHMFADDSLWLTRLLTEGSSTNLWIQGHFHFEPGGQEVNTIRHYYLTLQRSLEQRLFHQLHVFRIHNPSIKEFKEAFAFAKVVASFFKKDTFDVVVDVAGGHGALAALLLIMLPSVKEAIVVDPANVGKGGVERAWKRFYEPKTLRYRNECLRTGLPTELKKLKGCNKVLVVACHACQHLSEETLEISCDFGASAAVMACCQKDTSPGSSWKTTSKNLGIPMEKVLDILLAGKVMSWGNNNSYDVRMKTIDEKITPQNRVVLCRYSETGVARSTDASHETLERVYKRAHGKTHRRHRYLEWRGTSKLCVNSFVVGITVGLALSFTLGR